MNVRVIPSIPVRFSVYDAAQHLVYDSGELFWLGKERIILENAIDVPPGGCVVGYTGSKMKVQHLPPDTPGRLYSFLPKL